MSISRSLFSTLFLASFSVAMIVSAALPAGTAYADTPFSQGFVSLTFDDGWQSFADNAAGVLNTANLDGTLYINTQPVQDNFSGYMQEETLQAMKTAGHDIGGHTSTHASLVGVSSTTLIAEINDNRTFLENLGLGPIASFAYPFGEYDATVKAAVQSAGYTGARTVNQADQGFGPNYSDTDKFELRIEHVTSATTPSEIQAWIGTATSTKTWLVLMFHDVVNGAPTHELCTTDGDDNLGELTECSDVAVLQATVNTLVNNAVCVLTMAQALVTGEGACGGPAPITFTITASAGANGSISPNGAVVVNQGATQAFTITPNSGFHVDALTIDGTSTATTTSYSFSDVQAAHSINVTFAADPGTGGGGGGGSENPTPTCATGTLQDGQCVQTPVSACPEGTTYDAESNLCKGTTQAPVCATGTLNTATGMCELPATVVGDPTCPEGGDYVAETNQCMKFVDLLPVFYNPTCPEGSALNGATDKCETATAPVSACPATFTYNTGTQQCDPTDTAPACPSGVEGTVTAGQCTPNPTAPSCPSGYVLSGSTCVPDTTPTTPSCSDNQHLEGDVCVHNTTSSVGGGGGGGGGRYVAPVNLVPQVLGASTGGSCFQFTRNLSRGMTGNDIMELQKALKAKGYLVIDTPTMLYGPMTGAAVVKFQAANGLDQVGNVGPKTRALLNVCDSSAPGGLTDAQKAELLKTLRAQLDLLLKQIAQIIAERQQAGNQ